MFVDNQKFDDCFNSLLGYIDKNDEIDEETSSEEEEESSSASDEEDDESESDEEKEEDEDSKKGGRRKKRKGNGHKPTCKCPICKNMRKSGKKGGDGSEVEASDDDYNKLGGKSRSKRGKRGKSRKTKRRR